MGWGFVWLMVVLKIPIGLLLWLVWWAVRQAPEERSAEGGDGGTAVAVETRPRPRSPLPRNPRSRGPHGDPPVAGPPRTRARPHAARPRSREH